MNLGGLLAEFELYALNSYRANIKLSVPELRDFLKEFFTRRTFFINGIMYRGATSTEDGEPRFVFSEPDFTTDDYIEAILPELILLYTKAYGAPSDQPFSNDWSPKPFKAETDVEKQQAAIIKERIQEYNQKTLPFRLSKTMYHPLHTRSFSFTSGKVIPGGAKGEVIITSTEEIEEFIDSKTYYSLDGGKHLGLRDLWFEVLNEEASNPKFGWIDIDNPANLPEKEHKEVVSKISQMLTKAGRKHIIMFSGRNYQIWYAPMKGERFNFGADLSNLAETYGGKAGAIVGKDTYREKAIANGKIWVDTGVYKKNQKMPFFFGMHYKKGIEDSTGLVRVPLKRSELSSFDPLVDAHPENVLERFAELKARVDMFCQEASLGEGFPYADAGYPCYRTARGKNDRTHEMVKLLSDWKKPNMTPISRKVAGEEALQHESITVMPKLDGWLACMSFNTMGRFKVNGQDLDKTQKREGMIDSIQTERQRALMCTKGGLFAWDNHLTHAFENACRSIGVTEAIVTGEVVTYNDIGQIAGRESVTSILNRQEEDSEEDGISAHDTHAFRKAKLVIHDVLSFDGTAVSRDIPIAQRLALLAEVKNDRISVIPHETFTEDIYTNFEAFWSDNVVKANNEGVVVYGGGKRYKIKTSYTLDAVIIGVDTTAKYWEDKKEIIGKVVIAVSKSSSRGPAFIAFQRVGNFKMSEDQKRDLFHKILGERNNDGWERNSFANVLPYTMPINENIFWVDPKVVVEVEYESLGRETKTAYAFVKEQQKKGKTGWMEEKSGYSRMRPLERPLMSRRLTGPPVIIAERPDKSADIPSDISHEQADGAGGLQIGPRPIKIGAEELENPSRVKVTHVRTNPMYGYARGPRWIAGGGMSEPSPTEYFRHGRQKKAGHIAFGDAKKTMEDEFVSPIERGAPRRGQSGWTPNYKPIWDQARQHPQTGVSFYPELTGMPFSSADAIFDERGPNIPGGRKGIIESQSGKYSLKRLLSDEYHREDEQSVEDAKQLGRALGKELRNTATTSEDSRETIAQLVNKDITEEEKQKIINRKMGNKNFRKSNKFSNLERSVRSNPASANSMWNRRTQEYRKAYNEWEKEPEPKPSWKAMAIKRYEAWELPLLEKGRQFMDAEDNFIYTQAEEAIIHGRFPSISGEEEDHIFAVITLGDDDDEFES